MGVNYELPTVAPVFKDMNTYFEIEYQALDHYRRPAFMFGVLYDF
jgi:hypothetical protein